MNWIKEVRLENFQSHLDTSVSFTEGLNVIVGQSDSGKTAILRGIRWVLFNQPRGTDFMRITGDFVRVTLTFANDVSIIRERTSSKNRYIIKEIDKEDLVLEGFGIHVPQEVLDSHQIYPLRIDRDMELLLNISQQLDGPFLLEQTASVRAKTIGRISGAHYIDMAVRDTTKDVAKLQQQTKHVEGEVELLKEKIAPYHFLDKAKEQLDKVDKKYSYLKQLENRLLKLQAITKQLKDINHIKERVVKELTTLNGLEEWELSLERLQFIHEKKRSYQVKQSQITEIKKSISTCKVWIEKTNGVEGANKYATTITQQLNRLQHLNQLNDTYKRLNRSFIDVKTTINTTSFATMSEERKVQSLLQKVQSVTELRRLLQDYQSIKQQLNMFKNTIGKLEKMVVCEQSYSDLQTRIQLIKSYRLLRDNLTDLNKRLADGQNFVTEKKLEEQQLGRSYEKLLLEKGNCPTCGGQLNSTVIKQLLS